MILRSIRTGRGAALAILAASPCLLAVPVRAQAPLGPIHSMDVPQPRVVDPGPAGAPRPAPADAVVLFDGHDLSAWVGADDKPARWTVGDGSFTIAAGTGAIHTAAAFGDCQLHVEWSAPSVVKGEGQERGNSGVFLMGLYEVQVLDSYHNVTYPDGQASALYGQYPPLVNASRSPGEWQTYDIVFHAPRFDRAGKVMSAARVTVFHNGVLVQDGVELTGPTAHEARPPYEAHAPRLPLMLQDHGNPVRYRNIWLRQLGVDR